MIYAVITVALGIVAVFLFTWKIRVLETDRDNALMLIGGLRKDMDEARQVQGFQSEQIQDLGKRLTGLEDAPAAAKKEEPVVRFRGAADFRKFMEQGINS